MINNLEKWEPYSLCSLFLRPKKAHTKQKSYSRQHANHSRICGKQQKESPSRIRVGSLPGIYQASPSPHAPGRGKERGAHSEGRSPPGLGVPGAAAYSAAPSLPAPIGAPRSGGREDAGTRSRGWGGDFGKSSEPDGAGCSGMGTQRGGSLQGWQGENTPTWEMCAN